MKRFYSLLIMIVACMWYCVPAFAEALPTIVVGGHVTAGDTYANKRMYSWYEVENTGVLTIVGAIFSNNHIDTKTPKGINHSAVYNDGGQIDINGAQFINNLTITSGGALNNASGWINGIVDTSFINNQSKYGGAIYNYKTSTIREISNTELKENTAFINGGAIYSTGRLDSVKSSKFVSNTASGDFSKGAGYGGAIYANKDLTVENCTFTDNSAYRKGGAIAMMANDLTVIAKSYKNGDIIVPGQTIFSNNISGLGTLVEQSNDIYMGGSKQNLYLTAYDDSSVIDLQGGIDFANKITLKINESEDVKKPATGTVKIGGDVGTNSVRADVYLNGGEFSLATADKFNTLYGGKVVVNADTLLGFDIDLTKGDVDYDKLFLNSISGTGKLVFTPDSFNIIAGLTEESQSETLSLINTTANNIKSYVTLYDRLGNKTNIIFMYDETGEDILYKIKYTTAGTFIFSNPEYIDPVTNPLAYAVNYKYADNYTLTLTKNIICDSWEDLPDTPRNKLIVDVLTIVGKNKTITAENDIAGINIDNSTAAEGVTKTLYANATTFLNFNSAIINDGGYAALTDVSFRNNGKYNFDSKDEKFNLDKGGAILNNSGDIYILNSSKKSKSIFHNNVAKEGGAIHNTGNMVINLATFGAVGTKKGNYSNIAIKGGAIYNIQSDISLDGGEVVTNLTVSNSTFTSNGTYTKDKVVYTIAEFGGAIFNEGVDDCETYVTIDASTFNQNSAQNLGGAIYNTGKIKVQNSTIGQNKKTATNSAMYGGAVANAGTGSFVSEGTNYYYNKALETVDKTGGYGGAIYNTDAGYVGIKGGTISKNSAIKGGAIYNDENASLELDRLVTMVKKKDTYTEKYTYLTFSSNTATYGGAIYNAGAIVANNTSGEKSYPINCSGEFTKNSVTMDIQGFTGISRADEDDPTIYESPKGGAIYNEGSIILLNSNFTSNSTSSKVSIQTKSEYVPASASLVTDQITKFAGKGGAIYSDSDADLNIVNTTFTKNTAAEEGGAIYNNNQDAVLYLTNADFKSNSAKSQKTTVTTTQTTMGKISTKKKTTKTTVGVGGAIYTKGNIEINTNPDFEELVDLSVFQSNTANKGGAIYAEGTVNSVNAQFTSNKSTLDEGGAIYADKMVATENSVFSKNTAVSDGGGIYCNDDVDILNSSFASNKSTKGNGGAIYTKGDVYVNAIDYSSSEIAAGSTAFTSNSAALSGGAIYTESRVLIKDGEFKSNSAKEYGGAIYADGDIRIINSNFEKNSAKNGGALYVAPYKNATVINTSFVNNKAAQNGGAIYADTGSTVYIVAYNRDVVIANNKAGGKANSIYLNDAKLYLDAYTHKDEYGTLIPYTLTLSDGVNGNPGGSSELHFCGEGANLFITDNIRDVSFSDKHSTEGHIGINCEELIKATSFDLNGSNTYGIKNGKLGTLALTKLNMADGSVTNFELDVDLKTGESDKITAESITGTGILNASKLGLLSNSKTPVEVKLGENANISSMSATEAETKEATYKLKTSLDENGMLRAVVYGQKAKPCMLAAPVAAQLGGYLTQINSYDQAFMNMDMNMMQPRVVRNQNSGCSNNCCAQKDEIKDGINYNSKGLWTRPYATFEKVGLSNGPRVSNIGYGNFFGGDADMKELSNGWSRQFSAYIGYNGSNQDYTGQSIDQNGGTIGITEVWYKKNFFTGLTLNVSGNMAQAMTDLGRENMPMLMAGVASKTGYNFEFKGGKFIVQPSFLISYTFVHTFSHKTGNGVGISSSPLNAIQVAPGLKFIANLNNGWQPYFNINMRWNIMGDTHFGAGEVNIPEMSVNPYIEYGLGLQRKWGERFTGFGQAMVRNGGRNGVMLSFGFRWALGK